MDSAERAASATLRVMKHPAAARIGKAPKVTATVGEPVRLQVPDLDADAVYTVQIKRKGDTYSDLGVVQVGADGKVDLPVFTLTRRGTVTIAMISPAGVPTYIKIKVS